VQPYLGGINLANQITNKSLIMIIPTKDDQFVKFNITRKDNETGEIEA